MVTSISKIAGVKEILDKQRAVVIDVFARRTP
jgi:hypothetical protein